MFNRFNLNPFYAPESDIGASGSGEVAGSDTDASADPFESLSFSVGDDESEESDETEETKSEDVKEETEEETEEVKEETKEESKEETKEERTSKQSVEVDAAYARTRKAEERTAQLEKEIGEHKDWQKKQFGYDDLNKYRQDTEKQTQEQNQAKINEQWQGHMDMAQQMREAGYDERIVTQYLDAQKNSLQTQQELHSLQQQFNESNAKQEKAQQEQARIQQEKSVNEGRDLLVADHKALKAKYGDLVFDANGFDEIFQSLDPKMVQLISNSNLTMEEAFRQVNFDKIVKQQNSLTEKRTTANFVDRGKKSVETNKTEKKPEDTLTEGQKRFAKEFGVDPKEVAKRSNPKLFNKLKGVS